MVKLLVKTIRQLSEEFKLSKQAINQRINGFRSKHTYKVKNHLEIDNQGVKMLANFDKQKRQASKQILNLEKIIRNDYEKLKSMDQEELLERRMKKYIEFR